MGKNIKKKKRKENKEIIEKKNIEKKGIKERKFSRDFHIKKYLYGNYL